MIYNAGKYKTEILAPVGGAEQLTAAIRCGADAVYFGMQNFNARRNAENFADENLKDVIADCHLHGVRVNITLNTLVTDSEISDMHEAADIACEAGADAIIVQDLAVARYLKTAWPDVELHASTQMAVHNEEGVRILRDLGYDRIVLARELSLEEIQRIILKTQADCEVFVHGAHCMSVSGNCYMSSVIGGRSGNRGLCAQPCRLNWKKDGREYVLSLKDLSYITHIRELQDAGVQALKIEGRMKRAEYVAAAVTACREARDGGVPDMERLRAVFSRSGFTDGYLKGKRDNRMFGIRTKEDVTAARDVLADYAGLYHKEVQRVPVDMDVLLEKDRPFSVTVTDGVHSVSAEGAIPEKALNRPMNPSALEKQMKKTGGTPYYIAGLHIHMDDGLILNISKVNELRREVLEKLGELRKRIPERNKEYFAPEQLQEHTVQKRKIRMRFEKAEQIFPECGADEIVLPVREITLHPELLTEYGEKLIAELPSLLWPGEGEKYFYQLEELKAAGLCHVLCANIGAVEFANRTGLKLHGAPELNVLNSEAIAEYKKLGLSDVTVSFELSFEKMKRLKGELPRGMITYGRLPLMKFRNCPGRGEKGCADCNGRFLLTDRMNEKFPVLCRDRKYSELFNMVPVYVADKKMPDTDFEVLYFTVETMEECRNVWNQYQKKASPDFSRTGGLYYREIQ